MVEDKATDIVGQAITEGLQWLQTTYQQEGLVGTIVTLVFCGVFFGGMGAIFFLCAKKNSDSMKKNK